MSRHPTPFPVFLPCTAFLINETPTDLNGRIILVNELLVELSWSTSPRLRLFVLVFVLVHEGAIRGRGDTERDGEDTAYFLHRVFHFLAESFEQCRVAAS